MKVKIYTQHNYSTFLCLKWSIYTITTRYLIDSCTKCVIYSQWQLNSITWFIGQYNNMVEFNWEIVSNFVLEILWRDLCQSSVVSFPLKKNQDLFLVFQKTMITKTVHSNLLSVIFVKNTLIFITTKTNFLFTY